MNTTQDRGVLAVLRETCAGLHSVASECSRSDLSTPMRKRAEEMDAATRAIAELLDRVDSALTFGWSDTAARELRTALRNCNAGGGL